MDQATHRPQNPKPGSLVGDGAPSVPIATAPQEPWQQLTDVWNYCTQMCDRWNLVAEAVTPETIRALLEASVVVRRAGQADLADRLRLQAERLAELFDIQLMVEHEGHATPGEMWFG